MKTKTAIVAVILLTQISWVYSQIEIPYIGFNQAPGMYNPSAPAQEESFFAHVSYQDYWMGFQNAPQALNMNLFGKVADNMGVGINLNRTTLHIFNQTLFDASYSYRLQLHTDGFLSLGLALGIRRIKALQSDNPLDQYEPTLDGIYFDQTHYTTGFGVTYRFKGLEVGIAAPDVYLNSEFFSKYMGVVSYNITAIEDISLKPMVMYRKFSPIAEDYQIRLEAGFRSTIFLEVGYGNDVNIIAGVGFAFNDLRVGYYYSSLHANLTTVANGSNCIYLSYALFRDKSETP
jgi:type IX secretion system PorP/SprF family membrane protein